MSDTPPGDGWWQASDGKYYPPEQAPGAQPAETQPSEPQPAEEQPAGQQPVPPRPGGEAWAPPPTGYPYQQPPTQPKKSGMSKGVIILLVILAVLVLAIGGCIALLAFAGNEVVNELEDSFGVADEDHYDITLEECSADELGDAMANGTITNTSGDQRAFAVEVRFTDAEGTLITEDTTYTDDLDPDQTGQWEVVTFEDAPSGIECEIGEVSNWGLEGD